MSGNKKSAPDSGRVVALGGGTGLSTVLRGLRDFAPIPGQPGAFPISELTAIVTVTDDGGSSGRLRRDYSVLPPGDIRSCIAALADEDSSIARAFQFRFHMGRGLRGHSMGNLFLAALSQVTGDFAGAVRQTGELLRIHGRVLPSTIEDISLEALMDDGRIVTAERRISKARGPVRRVKLSRHHPKPLPESLEAIHRADLIILGPGSLYTSIIPNLLVAGVADAIANSRAKRIYICNLMTQPGETPKFKASDHVRAIFKHTKKQIFDWVILNNRVPCGAVLDRYRKQHALPVKNDVEVLQRLGLKCVVDELLEEHGVIRHNSSRLARLLLDEFLKR